MRKLLLFAVSLLFVSFSFTSCSSDDDAIVNNGNNVENPIDDEDDPTNPTEKKLLPVKVESATGLITFEYNNLNQLTKIISQEEGLHDREVLFTYENNLPKKIINLELGEDYSIETEHTFVYNEKTVNVKSIETASNDNIPYESTQTILLENDYIVTQTVTGSSFVMTRNFSHDDVGNFTRIDINFTSNYGYSDDYFWTYTYDLSQKSIFRNINTPSWVLEFNDEIGQYSKYNQETNITESNGYIVTTEWSEYNNDGYPTKIKNIYIDEGDISEETSTITYQQAK